MSKNKKPTQTFETATTLCLPSEMQEFSRRSLIATGVSFSSYLCLKRLFAPEKLYGQDGQEDYPPQRKLVWINMRGGWDILEVTDAKTGSTSGIDMIYDWGAAHQLAGSASDVRLGRWLPNMAAIGQDLLMVRGLAMGTTSHNAGSVYMDTGILSNSGNVNAASIPSIVASEGTATVPIIQLNGGADPQTDRGLLKKVSVVRANNLQLYRSMYPTTDDAISRRISMLDYVKNSITRLQDEVGTNDRLSGMAAAEEKIRKQFNDNVGSKLVITDAERAAFTQGAPQNLNRGMAESFALTQKLISEDLVNCVNLGIGGFDTHSNQSASLERTLTNVDFVVSSLVSGLRAAGKLDETLIVLYSDFGRTPKINNSNGRDHWPVGSAIMIGGGIQGGRAVGGSDDNLRAESINITTGEIDGNGEQINPTHLGGSVLELTLGSGYLTYRPYLQSIPALTRLKNS